MSKDPKNSNDHPKGKSDPPSKPKGDDTETDLWDLDDDQELATNESPAKAEHGSIPSRRSKESPIESRKPLERKIEVLVPIVENEDHESEENTDTDTESETANDSLSAKESNEIGAPKPSKDSSESEMDNGKPDLPKSDKTAPPAFIFSKGYFSSLSMMEKLGIFALAAILCITATLSIVHFSNSLEIKSMIAEDLDLPIEGKLVEVSSVETYWREPITKGENADVVRRGVKLVPIVRLGIESTSSKLGAIRVLFRDTDGIVIGDNISRSIVNKGSLEISSTDGFNDLGMHAAYRTGESVPWTVEVLEGPSVSAPIGKFVTLFETEISTDMR